MHIQVFRNRNSAFSNSENQDKWVNKVWCISRKRNSGSFCNAYHLLVAREEMHLNAKKKSSQSQKHDSEHLKTKQKSSLNNSQYPGFLCGPSLKRRGRRNLFGNSFGTGLVHYYNLTFIHHWHFRRTVSISTIFKEYSFN